MSSTMTVTQASACTDVMNLTGSQARPQDAGCNVVSPLPDEYYTKFLSDLAKSRKPSPIRSLFPLEERPGMISLLAGKPNPATFPITSLQFTARMPDGEQNEVQLQLDGATLAQGLQYSATRGIPQLVEWLTGLQERTHERRRTEGWGVGVTSGSQDGLYKAISALVNPGDAILIETPVYAEIIPIFRDLKCEMIEIESDSEGICSSSLRSVLANWPASKPRPRVLYTIPYGSNPTGVTATLERRREVIALAREYDLLILEDDPYFYVYFGKETRPPSYFALEAQEAGPSRIAEVGRVIRFDSLSKVMSSGIRIGFVTGPVRMLNVIDMHTGSSNLQVSSLTQVIAHALLAAWGYDGFKKHVDGVAEFYRANRDVFERAMRTHLTGLAEWNTPQAGMFYWFKLLLSDTTQGDSKRVIETDALARGVIALPGTFFLPGAQKTAYVRASFSLLDEEKVNEALRRLRLVILEARARKRSTSFARVAEVTMRV